MSVESEPTGTPSGTGSTGDRSDHVKVRRSVVHGDPCPEDILVDSAGRPRTALDQGSVTTAGVDAFDASTARGACDMSGPDPCSHDDGLLERLTGRSRDPWVLHRAAYAVAGADAYDSAAGDGRLTWCAAVFDHEDVKGPLGAFPLTRDRLR
ncbi:hypothetical protein [Nocardiopsis sp. ATB16-24]|uniref:hypothetical protein n=1 Tax=Nocardiopsis sp. ATB16-24 TaxID=3019555 RepID=UPI0025522176|nr:hypothetical protein [Nocardiopsis sp. ATB16-24]